MTPVPESHIRLPLGIIKHGADTMMEPAQYREKLKAMQLCNNCKRQRKSYTIFYISLRYLPLSLPEVIFSIMPWSFKRFTRLLMLPIVPP